MGLLSYHNPSAVALAPGPAAPPAHGLVPGPLPALEPGQNQDYDQDQVQDQDREPEH